MQGRILARRGCLARSRDYPRDSSLCSTRAIEIKLERMECHAMHCNRAYFHCVGYCLRPSWDGNLVRVANSSVRSHHQAEFPCLDSIHHHKTMEQFASAFRKPKIAQKRNRALHVVHKVCSKNILRLVCPHHLFIVSEIQCSYCIQCFFCSTSCR